MSTVERYDDMFTGTVDVLGCENVYPDVVPDSLMVGGLQLAALLAKVAELRVTAWDEAQRVMSDALDFYDALTRGDLDAVNGICDTHGIEGISPDVVDTAAVEVSAPWPTPEPLDGVGVL